MLNQKVQNELERHYKVLENIMRLVTQKNR